MNEHLTNRNYTKKEQIFDFMNEYNGKRKINFYALQNDKLLMFKFYQNQEILIKINLVSLDCKCYDQIKSNNLI